MSRLKYNGLQATLDAPGLTNSATSINFVAGLTYNGGTDVPTLTGSDYIPLTILDADGVPKEIVYLTAYTAAATSGTISRGQEGTTGVAHTAGLTIKHAATVLDLTIPPAGAYSNPIDDPANWPATVGIPDQEFDAGTMASPATSLPSGWSFFNQGGATWRESLGVGVVVMPTGGLDHRGVVQSLSGAPSTWNLYGKVEYSCDPAGTYTEAGICFREASSGKASQFGIYTDGSGYLKLMILLWSSNTGVTGFTFGPSGIGAGWKYWRIRRNSSTSYDYMLSKDGSTWFTIVAASNPGFTPDQIGFSCVRNGAGGSPENGIQWMRLR